MSAKNVRKASKLLDELISLTSKLDSLSDEELLVSVENKQAISRSSFSTFVRPESDDESTILHEAVRQILESRIKSHQDELTSMGVDYAEPDEAEQKETDPRFVHVRAIREPQT